ncbi:nuclear receptor coactivator 7 isoform X1 [Colossoma macropomum]|uniref:nuclear receptor coactivator 7 isoform X1 n=1 Tax=Colossoma macropomum TaxID=42526 RepID=UPI0018654EFB|nr:nuclear receptor coactivator 7 isoform X1 [Colossoma macropomum]
MGVAYSVGEVDHLYTFFVEWSPDLYTKHGRKQSFLVVDKQKLAMIDSLLSESGPKKWEIITVRKSVRSQSVCSTPSVCTSEDEEETLPALNHTSYILQEHHIESLAAHLPARVQGCVWDLVYSTAEHGTSLRTLYRKTAQVERPVLLLIKDVHNQVFGAFSSDTFRVSDSCYGTGETFLFTFGPEFKTFCWSGENSYFVRGFLDSLQMGGGGGPFGLWLDADLCRGSTFSCNTFRNQPLSPHQDFTIQAVEVWTFL